MLWYNFFFFLLKMSEFQDILSASAKIGTKLILLLNQWWSQENSNWLKLVIFSMWFTVILWEMLIKSFLLMIVMSYKSFVIPCYFKLKDISIKNKIEKILWFICSFIKINNIKICMCAYICMILYMCVCIYNIYIYIYVCVCEGLLIRPVFITFIYILSKMVAWL